MVKPLAERFWSKVERRSGNECWPWRASVQRGYGAFRLTDATGRRRQVNAQRVAYVLTWGPIPDGEHILHLCDTPLCCNPRHLVTGTRSENMRQMVERGRRKARPGGAPLGAAVRAAIREELACGVPVRRIAARHEVAPVTVRVIRDRAEVQP